VVIGGGGYRGMFIERDKANLDEWMAILTR